MEKTYKDWMIGLALSSLVLIIYANSLVNGFVADDSYIILKNPVFHDRILSLFYSIDTDPTQLLPFYRPLTYLTFYIERLLHGFEPHYMHACNVILHAANTYLVYLLAGRILTNQRSAILAGVIFAVHPIHSESVNYLSGGRNTMLACFFVLAALLFHLKSISTGRFPASMSGSLLFLAGLFSKEMAIMLLPVLFLLEFRNVKKTPTAERARAALRMVPYLLATAGYLILRWLTLSVAGIQTSIIPGFGAQKLHELYSIPDFGERIFKNVFIIPKYVLTLIWPAALSPRYSMPGDMPASITVLMIVWACIITVVIRLLASSKYQAERFGLVWAAAFWIPVSGVVYFSSITMADRYLYLPAIGMWITVASQFIHFTSSGNRIIRNTAASCGIIILIVFAGMTVKRNFDWKNDRTLFARMVEQYPENPHGHYNLGAAYLIPREAEVLQQAERHLLRALALDKSLPSVHALLGYIRLQSGDLEGSSLYLTKALKLNPLDREARINRGITLEGMGRYREALEDYEYYLTLPNENYLPGSREYAEEKVIELRQSVQGR